MRTQPALLALRALRSQRDVLRKAPVRVSASRGYATPGPEHPIDKIIKERLDDALEEVQSATHETPTSSPIPTPPRTQREEIIAKAQIVFGSKLVGPQRQAQLDAKSRLVAGVLVPPKPEEPDNCCMSGCVNCVWDMYRDEMEDWIAKSAEARARVAEQKAAPMPSSSDRQGMSPHVAMSMDDDGGGSESNWDDEGPILGDVYEGIPIGIKAFMENEKRLKAKQRKEAVVD